MRFSEGGVKEKGYRKSGIENEAIVASSPVSIQTQSLALRALRALRLDGNRAKRKRFDQASYWLQAAANRMLGRSSGNHDWLLANASDCVWMETGL